MKQEHAQIRVRFAPSPTGMMHLGNVRTALMNYLFARQKKGTFIIRIEDTDMQRNVDPHAHHILDDLAWLGLTYDEGPNKDGLYAPYFQSQRTEIYQEHLKKLEQQNLIYRCFCSPEELEAKRARQLALKQPPHYDRTCLKLSAVQINDNLSQGKPFIWRFKLDQDKPVIIHDLAHGTITFDMKSFSDIPLTRQDGSFTFMFANFVDDVTMAITHVIRGEDHLSNTAGQVAMYQASGATIPLFWHLPIICNVEGKKLSKRDFGFSLNDLRNAGFLPQAIDNYLAIIGASYKEEFMSLQELAQTLDFEHLSPTSQIKYDVEKLKWLNHKWINSLDNFTLAKLCRPYLQEAYPQAQELSDQALANLINTIKTDLNTLLDSVKSLEFYFVQPTIHHTDLELLMPKEQLEKLRNIIAKNMHLIENAENFLAKLKSECQQENIAVKNLFAILRLALMGTVKGPSIHDIMHMLGIEQTYLRLEKIITT